MEIFLIISNLNDKRNVESFLHVFAEDERKHMPKMKGLWWRSSSCIQIERRYSWISKSIIFLLMSLACSKNGIKISMWKEDSSFNIIMSFFACVFLDSLDKFFSEGVASKFLNELVIVDLFVCSTWYSVGIDNKIFSLFFRFFSLRFGFLLRGFQLLRLWFFHQLS